MIRKPQNLNTRGLIGAAMALASGAVLAEQAGRVSFVTGEVKATATDGSVRSLARGDLINGGDRISTGAGRLQIRFTDGGFVSLQPNTVFGVDQYLYANKAPEETSLFFSLLQGGMRTITGAIGKVNKQSYKVRTPVATIGIRGTEYLARVDAKRLIVSVGSGFVNVYNEHGSTTGGAGQNVQAIPGQAPGFTSDDPDVQATGPEGDVGQFVASDDTGHNDTQTAGDQVTPTGDNVILENAGVTQKQVLPDGDGYTLLSINNNEGLYISGSYSTLTGAFSAADGSPTKLEEISEGTTTFQPGTLKFVNVETEGTVSWGEVTNGEASPSAYFMPTSVAENQFLAYVIGKAVTPTFTGKATYSLLGGTPARLNGSTAGTLGRFNLTLNLALGIADVDLLLTMSGEEIKAYQQGVNLDGDGGYKLNIYGINTTSTGSFCASSSCSTNISGFFSGENGNQLGLGYQIYGSGGTITGTAGLGMTVAPTPQTDGYAIMTSASNSRSYSPAFLAAAFNTDGSISYLTQYACEGNCYVSGGFDPGTLKRINFGSSPLLAWGEYTDGSVSYDNLGLFESSLSNTAFNSYIIGQAVAPTFSGKATYSLLGGTPARLNGTTEGKLDHLNITLNTALGIADVDMMVKMSGDEISVDERGVYLDSVGHPSYFNLSSMSATSSLIDGICADYTCSANMLGFFAGNEGAQLAVNYEISNGTDRVTGSAATIQQGAPLAATAGYSLLTNGYSYNGTIEAALNADGSINFLVSQDYYEGAFAAAVVSNGSYTVGFDPGSMQLLNFGHSNYLSWGEYTNGDASISSISGTPYSLNEGSFQGYILGKLDNFTALQGAQKASYSMIAGSGLARLDGADSATVTYLAMDLNLAIGTVDAVMTIDLPTLNDTITVGATGMNMPLVTSTGTNVSSFNLSSYNGLSASSSGLFCDSEGGGCYSEMNFFFAGDASEIATNFYVYSYAKSQTISGTAALAQTGKTTDVAAPLQSGTGFTVAAAYNGQSILNGGDPYGDIAYLNSESADASFDSAGNLKEVLAYNASDVSARVALSSSTDVNGTQTQTATVGEYGSYKTLSWGRMSGTAVAFNNELVTLGSTESVAYVVGHVTPVSNWNNLNYANAGYKATYSVVGATNAKDQNGSVGTLDTTKTNLTLYFGSTPSLDVALRVSMDGGNSVYDASGSTSMAALGCGPATFSAGLSTTLNGSACGGSGCSTAVHGFFSGAQAEQAGMSYSIVDQSNNARYITGAAGLATGALQAVGTQAPATQL